MTPATYALQKGLYQTLIANAALAAELGDPPRVFDDPPPGTAMPYVVLGEAKATQIAGGGVEHDVRIEIFSRHGGRAEVKRILDLVVAALHEADFPLDGATLVNCRFVYADIARAEGDLFRAAARFRCVTQ